MQTDRSVLTGKHTDAQTARQQAHRSVRTGKYVSSTLYYDILEALQREREREKRVKEKRKGEIIEHEEERK